MTIDAAIKEIKENMLCDYCISGCDKCDISSCSNKDAFNMAIQALERNRKKLLKFTLMNIYALLVGKKIVDAMIGI